MSTIIMTLIGVVIFSAVMIGSWSYIDASHVATNDDGIYIANRMEMAAEIFVEIENQGSGSPSSEAELIAAGLPVKSALRDGEIVVSGNTICYVLPYSEQNRKSLSYVQKRLGGTVSGACGNANAEVSNVIVETLPL